MFIATTPLRRGSNYSNKTKHGIASFKIGDEYFSFEHGTTVHRGGFVESGPLLSAQHLFDPTPDGIGSTVNAVSLRAERSNR